MAKGNLQIHTENILPIIKKWLYSEKDIFIRELVSNSCDAISKTRILRDAGELSVADETFQIELVLDVDARTLTITDNGIGMTGEEVEKYIAQVAFSGAEEFLGKYKGQEEKDQIIGHFGLGFYSAYMVSKTVTIDTLSYREGSLPVLWSCDGSSEYSLEEGTRTSRGTAICLHIDQESDEYLQEHKLREMLEKYCAFLPYPILLNGTRINTEEPLWLKNPSQCSDEEYLKFYRTLYPMDADPLFWIHLNVDYPFHVQGILYFPKIHQRFDWNKSAIKLFCNRVFVSDQCKDLIPDYLTALKGVIDSHDIPLNVSRSTLQIDQTVRQLSSHISKKVTDKLSNLYQNSREKFLTAWKDIELIVKLGALQDDKFYERSRSFLIWKTVGGEVTTIDEYLERHKETYQNKIFYAPDAKQAHLLNIYTTKGIELLIAPHPIDTALINRLEGRLAPVTFQRADGAIDPIIVDGTREKSLLDAEGKTESSKIADFIRAALRMKNIEVEAKSLASDTLPGFILIDEQTRRMRDYLALSDQKMPDFAEKQTFVVNTNNQLINSLYALQEKNASLANELVNGLYKLSLLSQKELKVEEIPQLVEQATGLFEKLLAKN